MCWATDAAAEALGRAGEHDAAARDAGDPLAEALDVRVPRGLQRALGVLVGQIRKLPGDRVEVVSYFDTDGDQLPAIIVQYADLVCDVTDAAAFDAAGGFIGTVTGRAKWLGERAAFDAFRWSDDARIKVVANVFDWLADEGRSLLVLDHQRAAREFNERGVRIVETSDRALGRELNRALKPPRIIIIDED